jgi:iron(III) transport system ATP-binding protein
MSNLILEIKDVSHSYDENETTLKNINLEVNEGEKVSILGPSGSGKSTLLRLIAGLEKPYSGTIAVQGKMVSSVDYMVAPEKRNVGLVVQEKALFPHLTVAKNIGFGIRKSQERSKIISELLSLFKIEHLSNKYPHEISGGEQQRVALARSMAPNPELLLLDEPFSALDKELKEELYTELNQIFKERKQTIVLVTHDLDEAKVLSEKQINLENT